MPRRSWPFGSGVASRLRGNLKYGSPRTLNIDSDHQIGTRDKLVVVDTGAAPVEVLLPSSSTAFDSEPIAIVNDGSRVLTIAKFPGDPANTIGNVADSFDIQPNVVAVLSVAGGAWMVESIGSVPGVAGAYVLRIGDTMTGDLEMTASKVVSEGGIQLDTDGAAPASSAALRGLEWALRGAALATGVAATGRIETGAVLPDDGDWFVMSDGQNPPVRYEFDDNGSVVQTPILRSIDISASVTAADVAAAVDAAIGGAPLTFITSTYVVLDDFMLLANDAVGALGNVAIISSVNVAAGFISEGMSGGLSGAPDVQQLAIKTSNDLYVNQKLSPELTPFVLVENGPYSDLREVVAAAGDAASADNPQLVLIGPGYWSEAEPIPLPGYLVLASLNGQLERMPAWDEYEFRAVTTVVQASWITDWDADEVSSFVGLYMMPGVDDADIALASCIEQNSSSANDSMMVIGCHITTMGTPGHNDVAELHQSLVKINDGEIDFVRSALFIDGASPVSTDIYALEVYDLANALECSFWGQYAYLNGQIACLDGGYIHMLNCGLRGGFNLHGASGATLKECVVHDAGVWYIDDFMEFLGGNLLSEPQFLNDDAAVLAGVVEISPNVSKTFDSSFANRLVTGSGGAEVGLQRVGRTLGEEQKQDSVETDGTVAFAVGKSAAGADVVMFGAAAKTVTLQDRMPILTRVMIHNGSGYELTVVPQSGTIDYLASIVVDPFSSRLFWKVGAAEWQALDRHHWLENKWASLGATSNPFNRQGRIKDQTGGAPSFPVAGDDETKGYRPGDLWLADENSLFICTVATADAAKWKRLLPVISTVAPGVGNDEDSGFPEGTTWIDSVLNNAYISLDGATGAAVWKQTTP